MKGNSQINILTVHIVLNETEHDNSNMFRSQEIMEKAMQGIQIEHKWFQNKDQRNQGLWRIVELPSRQTVKKYTVGLRKYLRG